MKQSGLRKNTGLKKAKMEHVNNVALKTGGVAFSYPDGTRALHDITLDIYNGEITALLAANGSGKTTLIKIFAGLLRPQHGVVSIWGNELSRYCTKALYQHIGVVFQNPQDQLFAATVKEDVGFGPKNLDLGEAEIVRRVRESLEAVGASDLLERPVHHLSFGQQKRVAIAGVLAMEPSILILDEPTAGLDPVGEELMVGLLQRINRELGITIIMATHSVDIVPLLSHRVVILHEGKLWNQGTPEEVFTDSAKMRHIGLRLPYIGTLFEQLGYADGIQGHPLTIQDACKRLRQLLPVPSNSHKESGTF